MKTREMDEYCIACGDCLSEKKRYVKQKLWSVREEVFEMLKTLFQEEVGGNVNLNYLKEKGAVICRKCKCNITSYIHARALIIERLHQAATVIQSQSVYAWAECCCGP